MKKMLFVGRWFFNRLCICAMHCMYMYNVHEFLNFSNKNLLVHALDIVSIVVSSIINETLCMIYHFGLAKRRSILRFEIPKSLDKNAFCTFRIFQCNAIHLIDLLMISLEEKRECHGNPLRLINLNWNDILHEKLSVFRSSHIRKVDSQPFFSQYPI